MSVGGEPEPLVPRLVLKVRSALSNRVSKRKPKSTDVKSNSLTLA